MPGTCTRPSRVDGLAGGPLGVGLLLAAVVGLVGAGVHHDHVVEHAVGLEQVAVAVLVALVLDVVVGEREVRVGVGQRLHRVDGHLPVPRGLSGWPTSLAGPASQESAEYHASECGSISQRDGAADLVAALGHLEVVVAHRAAAQVDAAARSGRTRCVRPSGVDDLLVVLRAEVGHPEGVVVAAGAAGGRVRQLVVQRAAEQSCRAAR